MNPPSPEYRGLFLFRRLVEAAVGGVSGLNTGITGQGGSSRAEGLVGDFLAALCGDGSAEAEIRIRIQAGTEGPDRETALLFLRALSLIPGELDTAIRQVPSFRAAAAAFGRSGTSTEGMRGESPFWNIFFPEGMGIIGSEEAAVAELRRKRAVAVTSRPDRPILDPFGEILFTANALLTLPFGAEENTRLSPSLQERVAAAGEQRYWYDHPVSLGSLPRNNEIIYGLTGFDSALAFERRRGVLSSSRQVPFLLSASVTHDGLQEAAKEWIEAEVSRWTQLRHLTVYLVTENDAKRLVDDVLAPAAKHGGRGAVAGDLGDVFGVDGRYGRHYSFLKAIAALYAVLVDPSVRATFKIDLDQVFPQEQLVAETGRSAFEHLASPLWGARGRDSDGREVELGMIAGALVNDRDIHRSVFTPDVSFPRGSPRFDELVFYSLLPQALSTEAEMMVRYDGGPFDGETACLERLHVTGGTTGILVDSLRRFRPFTPSFIARAEDQAYLLSVLFSGEPCLRYLHQPGLIMRHDKESFAAEAISKAAAGKLAGDCARIILFSRYAALLPWTVDATKAAADPFTGCFISPIPVTVATLRLSLRAVRLFRDGSTAEAVELLRLGALQLLPLLEEGAADTLRKRFEEEQRAWNLLYDILDDIEGFLREGDAAVIALREKAREIFASCLVGSAGPGSC